jgi:hypothetical protein
LIGWDVGKTYAKDEGEMSANPNLPEGTLKRRKPVKGTETETDA